jgi:hypothetical protein
MKPGVKQSLNIPAGWQEKQTAVHQNVLVEQNNAQ